MWRRDVPKALLPFALHGLAREVDGAVGTLLHTSLDLPDFVWQALALLDPGRVLLAMASWTAGGTVAWWLLAAARARREGGGLAAALKAEAGAFGPLYLRPALTLLALVSLVVLPTFPYGFTLPVALTQDWGPAQDAAALAAFAAGRLPLWRVPAPRAGAIFFMAFLAYALLSPPWAREWDGHPGNEPKTLRMAVALGHGLTLDVEGVSGPMEWLEPRPFLPAARDAAVTTSTELWRLASTLVRGGYRAVGASAIQATRVTRQTVRGKEGGIYYVLAPGPAFLLAPALRLDRALNQRRRTEGRLAVTLLAWNAVAAALVAAVFLLARDATGRPGLAAAVAGFFGFVPPLLFYFYQFYPETLGALGLAVALRLILFKRRWTPRTACLLGLLLAALPWLHQKFLPVWIVLVAMAVIRAVDEMVDLGTLIALLVPQAASVLLIALYNFAITASARPDALYLAWGPAGVTSERMGQGLLGLALDARYGIVPYAPVYLLIGGLIGLGRPASHLRWALPAAVVYYLTVASADNWSGAVCSLGRYVMPLVPLVAALVVAVLDRTGSRRGALGLALTLAAWTGLIAVPLWRDPLASNDCALMLAKSAFADGNVYIPNLFIKTWSEGAPGLLARIVAWIVLAAAVALWLRRVAQGRGGRSPGRALAGATAAILAAAFLLERWPSAHGAPRFQNALDLGGGATAFVSDATVVGGEFARVGQGGVDILVRSRTAVQSLTVTAEGEGLLRLPGRAPLALFPRGTRVDLPLQALVTLTGRRGVQETLYRQRVEVKGPDGAVLRLALTAPPDGRRR